MITRCSFQPALRPWSAGEEDWPQCWQVPLGGEREVRVGEVRWCYRMLIPGNWRDFKTTWYAVSCWRRTWSGVVSGSLWITRMDQHFWKVSWWDWVWMGTGRSEFVTVHEERCPLTCLESIWPVSPMQKASHFLHWSWYIRLDTTSAMFRRGKTLVLNLFEKKGFNWLC